MSFTIRPTLPKDIPYLEIMISDSISVLQEDFLSPAQIQASYEFMGIDNQLIDDGTYYTVIADSTSIAGCGGWSRRDTLFGGNHSPNRNSRLLEPATEPARIRAMYTNLNFTRRGVGKMIINHCEQKAHEEGFHFFTMAATLSGEPLYRKCGYKPIEHFNATASNDVKVPLIRMEKYLA
jgi:GNAT superfamily N-acetyltransferase